MPIRKSEKKSVFAVSKLNSFVLVATLIPLAGCINLSALQTAETLEQGKGRAIIGGGYYTSPAINEAIEEETDSTVTTADDDFEDITVPYLELGYRYGVTDKFEVGGKLTLIGTIAVDGKYQLLDNGDFDIAAGAGIGYVTLESESGSGATETKYKNTIIDFTVPVYLSYRLSPAWALYSSPKAIYRNIASTSTIDGKSETDNTGTTMVGATAGVMIGETWGLALEGTYMKDTASDFDMLQVATALFF